MERKKGEQHKREPLANFTDEVLSKSELLKEIVENLRKQGEELSVTYSGRFPITDRSLFVFRVAPNVPVASLEEFESFVGSMAVSDQYLFSKYVKPGQSAELFYQEEETNLRVDMRLFSTKSGLNERVGLIKDE